LGNVRRRSASEGARAVQVRLPALLIPINLLYRHDMTPLELYEATRGTCKLGERRKGARYAFAAFEGVVRDVYETEGSESTDKSVCATSMLRLDRWELTME
jgi:hypothetical protein